MVGCWCLPWRTMAMGTQWTPPWTPVPTDVPPCCCNWPEQTQPCYPLGLEGTITQTRPGGRAYHHGTHSAQLYLGRHSRPVPGCVLTLEATQERPVWGGYQRAPPQGNSQLHQEIPPVQVAICTARGGMESVVSWCTMAWSLYRVCHGESLHLQEVCCHKTGLMWGSIGPHEVCPQMCSGSCGSTQKDGEDEPFPQPLAFGQLQMLGQPLAFRQPPKEILVLRMPRSSPYKKARCQLPPAGAPGNFLSKGHCPSKNPVT